LQRSKDHRLLQRPQLKKNWTLFLVKFEIKETILTTESLVINLSFWIPLLLLDTSV
jgi:hypothetical protein